MPRCGDRKRLEVHHLNYDRLGCEHLTDVEVVCEVFHGPADMRGSRAPCSRPGEAVGQCIRSFMTKKHGEDYEDDYDSRQEFQEWLEGQY